MNTKKFLKDYDEAVLAFETVLGCAAEMALFIGKDVKDFISIDSRIIYSMGIVGAYLKALTSDLDIIGVKKLDVSEINNVEKKLDIILAYFQELIAERENGNGK